MVLLARCRSLPVFFFLGAVGPSEKPPTLPVFLGACGALREAPDPACLLVCMWGPQRSPRPCQSSSWVQWGPHRTLILASFLMGCSGALRDSSCLSAVPPPDAKGTELTLDSCCGVGLLFPLVGGLGMDTARGRRLFTAHESCQVPRQIAGVSPCLKQLTRGYE